MDQALKERLSKIHEQIERLSLAEESYLNLKASKDSTFGVLFQHTTGSIKEREAEVYSSNEWKAFAGALVQAEVEYLKQKRMLDLMFKAYDAAHLSFKIENQGIQSTRGIT